MLSLCMLTAFDQIEFHSSIDGSILYEIIIHHNLSNFWISIKKNGWSCMSASNQNRLSKFLLTEIAFSYNYINENTMVNFTKATYFYVIIANETSISLHQVINPMRSIARVMKSLFNKIICVRTASAGA